jgi:cytochrome c oxidase assembly protein subunit 15
LLGGLRVILDAHEIAGVKLGVVFGIFHACLAQGFFVLLCAIALFTSRWGQTLTPVLSHTMGEGEVDPASGENSARRAARTHEVVQPSALKWLLLATTILIFLQLILGATMRHQHAGLAISDFPLAHGKLWPATDPESIQRYNEQRIEIAAANPITAFQVQLQMVHRVMAVLIFLGVAVCARQASRSFGSRNRFSKLSFAWLGLILIQVGLGAWTVLSHKAADIATAHVLAGVLSLATGAMLCIFTFRSLVSFERATAFSGDVSKTSALATGSAQS